MTNLLTASLRAFGLGVVALVGVLSLMSNGVFAADAPRSSSQLDTYTKDGDSSFALSLSPSVAKPAAKPRDVTILFDTSASQAGDYRDKALKSLDAALASLGAQDRVQLYAVDLNAIPLTSKPVAANSPDMQRALATLRSRTPLGSTDMVAALTAACDAPGADASRVRAAVYIGDGMSTANLINSDALRATVERLVAAETPVISYAIGPRRDTTLLACLANQTGGMLAIDGDNVTGAQVGAWLAETAKQPVVWPKSIQMPAALHSVTGARALPLRFDRETILLGTGESAGPVEVSMSAVVEGKPQELKWNVPAAVANPDLAFLPKLIETAQRDEGFSLPTLGKQGLDEARRLMTGEAQELARLGRMALAVGDVEQARQLADRAVDLDANDPGASALQRVAASDKGDVKLTGGGGAQADGVAPASEPLVADGREPTAGELMDEYDRDVRVREQALQTQVRVTIDNSRKMMSANPELVQDDLKLLLERVRAAGEVSAALRGQLSGQIETVLQQASRVSDEKVFRELKAQAVQATLDANKQLTQDLRIDQLKVEQLIVRMNSLLAEGRPRDAEMRATQAREIFPDNITTQAAVLEARTIGYVNDMIALREKRQRGVVEALYAVELSHVPTSDEPPIVYPSAEEWLMKTEMRKHYLDSTSLYKPGSAEKKIYDALNEPITLDLDESSLQDAVDYIRQKADIEVKLDNKALADAAIDASVLVTFHVKGITLKSALKQMLEDFELTYVVQDETLKITSKEKADGIVSTRVYPVADLVVPVQTQMMGGMGGMGGGMMGGMGGGMMGGGMGGMGGGMMGGMGGGMGGMGGGMGGFMNVPPTAKAPAKLGQAGGFRAFAVKDSELKLSGKAKSAAKTANTTAASPTGPQPSPSAQLAPSADTSATVAVKAPTTKPAAPSLLAPSTKSQPASSSKEAAGIRPSAGKSAKRIELPAGADPATAWNDHFATNQESPEAVWATVEYMVSRKQFASIVHLITAAIQNGQPQPWMYETLGLAMKLDNRKPEDVERVLMSALDFVNSADHMLYLAQYLSDAGFEKRALSIFHQVALLEPSWAKPNVQGLRLAKRLDDIDGIEWSTLGIVSQAWNGDEAVVWKEAHNTAVAAIEKLRSEGRISTADNFERKLKEALSRDVVIVISWSGTADVDLQVEEPANTFCSAHNPRTSSGGTLLTSSSKGRDVKTNALTTEEYVCPQGFDGTYKALIRRAWGKLPTGKVSVEVYTHYLGKNQERLVRKQIPLTNDEALIVFDLKDGRRTEPMSDRQVANAVAGTVAKQVAVGQQILAQQLAKQDATPTASFYRSRGIPVEAEGAAAGAAADGGAAVPFFARGAVGYQPVLTTLTSGASMFARAVVSADRRYVRVSPTPNFTGIGEVNTFNFVSGSSGTSNGGNTGGAGATGINGGGIGGGGFGGF